MKRFAELISERGSGGGGGSVSSLVGGGIGAGSASGGLGGEVPPGGGVVEYGTPGFAYEERGSDWVEQQEEMDTNVPSEIQVKTQEAPVTATDDETIETEKEPDDSSSPREIIPPVANDENTQAQEDALKSDWKIRNTGTAQTRTSEQVAEGWRARQASEISPLPDRPTMREVPPASAKPEMIPAQMPIGVENVPGMNDPIVRRFASDMQIQNVIAQYRNTLQQINMQEEQAIQQALQNAENARRMAEIQNETMRQAQDAGVVGRGLSYVLSGRAPAKGQILNEVLTYGQQRIMQGVQNAQNASMQEHNLNMQLESIRQAFRQTRASLESSTAMQLRNVAQSLEMQERVRKGGT
jgi:hypothetical protein